MRNMQNSNAVVETLLIDELKELLADAISMELCLDPVTPPCGHSISNKQITTWLRDKRTCPTCKHNITLPFSADVTLTKISSILAVANDDVAFIKLLKLTLICPVSNDIIKTPVTTPCGHTFDQEALKNHETCPHVNCKQPINPIELPKNFILIKVISIFRLYAPKLIVEKTIDMNKLLKFILNYSK